MKQILQASVAVLMLSSLSVFAATKAAENTPDNIYSEDKSTITVSASQPEFVLKLKSNPTTGYAWFLREYNANLITPVKHSYQAPDKELIGAPGFELWTFKIKPAGFVVPQQTTMRMVYARPWQGSDSSSQLVFRITTTSEHK